MSTVSHDSKGRKSSVADEIWRDLVIVKGKKKGKCNGTLKVREEREKRNREVLMR